MALKEYIYNITETSYSPYNLLEVGTIKKDKNKEFIIDYDYEEGEEEIHTLPNGDPGSPAYGPEITLLTMFTELKDKNGNMVSVNIFPILELIEDGALDLYNIEKEISESHE